MRKWIWLSVVIVIADLGTKFLASQSLSYNSPVEITPFFNLTLLHNKGAAFSILAGASGWQRYFFIILAIGVSVGLVIWLHRLPPAEKWLSLAVSLVLGGAVGNLYDRIVHGYVVDFIHLHYAGYHFPAFNIADCAITAGALLIAADVFRHRSHDDGEDRPLSSAGRDNNQ